jgi:hypothetical protein
LAIVAAPTRRAAVGAMLLIGAVMARFVYFISLYPQKVQGFSPLATGLALVPSTGDTAQHPARSSLDTGSRS